MNCRDLDTLAVDLARLEELADDLPPGYAHVAESGVASEHDVRAVVDAGYRLALVGTTLMNSPDPRNLLGQMLAAGRERAPPATGPPEGTRRETSTVPESKKRKADSLRRAGRTLRRVTGGKRGESREVARSRKRKETLH